VRNYPLSPLVPGREGAVEGDGAPVPQPDPKAVAWMTAEQNAPRQRTSLVKKPMDLQDRGRDRNCKLLHAWKTDIEPDRYVQREWIF